MNRKVRSGGVQHELEVLKEIIKSSPALYEKVIKRMRNLRHQHSLTLNDYVKEKESARSSDRLDSRNRNYST